jgi:hydroxymethylpyrimidine kinase/phosphomethylpyrimidine kinase
MKAEKLTPVALTIAGSDSGGGAGIQADLKTFASLDVHGTCAITAVTAQNPKAVQSVHVLPTKMVREQIDSVAGAFPPAACKTGMLYSAAIIREVERFFRQHRLPLIVDPVMAATSGSRLLQKTAVDELKKLFRVATLITPNLPEAERLLGRPIRSEEGMRSAAKELHEQFGCAVVVKGGHLRGAKSAVDIFFDGTTELLLAAPYVKNASTHGTGCTYSAAVTAYLAHGASLPKAVQQAKEYIAQAIARGLYVGSHHILNTLWTV